KDVLHRIDQRLAALGLNESVAAKKAKLSDSAIRNMRRAVRAGKEQGASTMTLDKLAPVLKTTAAWLLTGEGEETPPIDSIDRMMADAADILGEEEAETLREELKQRITERKNLIERLRQTPTQAR